MSDRLTATPLTEAIGASRLQEIQDRFASLVRVSITIMDADGRLITQPSCSSDFCRLLASVSAGRSVCAASADSSARAAAESGSTTLGRCHAELMQYSTPITQDGRHVGTIVVGDRPAHGIPSDSLDALAIDLGLDRKELAEAASALSASTPDRERTIEQLLELLAATLGAMCLQQIELGDRVDELTTVCDLAGMLASTDDLQEILDTVAVRVCEVLKVKACGIRLLDESGGELVVRAVHNLSQRYLDKGAIRVDENPIDGAAIRGETVYIEDARSDPRIRFPKQAREEGIVSGLCVPMTYRGSTIGVVRVYTDRLTHFGDIEVAVLRAIASLASAAIINTRLYTDRRASDEYERQLRDAGEIQRRMIPAQPPPHRCISFGTVYDPSLDVGGDFFDFLELRDGQVGVCIADVVGKGISAGLMMASIRSAFRAYAQTLAEPEEVVSRVNRHLCRDTLVSEFATLFYGVFSADGRQLTYCSAGHDPPLLLRYGKVERLNIGGLVIGVDPNEPYTREVLELEAGDIVIFYTDGVVEAMDFDGRSFGRDRLRRSLLRHQEAEAPTLAQQLLWDVRRFAGLATQSDDITLVVAKVG